MVDTPDSGSGGAQPREGSTPSPTTIHLDDTRLTPAQRLLRQWMSDYSETNWCAVWLSGIEYELWEALQAWRAAGQPHNQPRWWGFTDLEWLADHAGGWWSYDRFYPMAAWLAHLAEREQS